MKTAPKTKKAIKTAPAKKAKPIKKPSMENTGTGKNNPVSEPEKDTDVEQYKDLDSSKETGEGIHQTVDESDNVGKDIDYK